MCEECRDDGPCLATPRSLEPMLAICEDQAHLNRTYFREKGILAVNLMGSPGSGKTALLEATAHAGTGLKLRALAGDPATEYDAERLRAAGMPSFSITTGSICHLNAGHVHRALHATDWRKMDVLFLENVGNLVCPAFHDLGQTSNVVVLSVTEGEDKPLKFRDIFSRANAVVVTKIDLIPYLPDFHWKKLEEALVEVMPQAEVIPVSAGSGDGLEAWLDWIDRRRRPVMPVRHPSRDRAELHA